MQSILQLLLSSIITLRILPPSRLYECMLPHVAAPSSEPIVFVLTSNFVIPVYRTVRHIWESYLGDIFGRHIWETSVSHICVSAVTLTLTDSLKHVLLHHNPANTMVLYVLSPPSTHGITCNTAGLLSLYLFSR